MDDDLDDRPYQVSHDAASCPQCDARWGDDAIACPACGFQLPTESQQEGVKPIKRRWDASPTMHTRRIAFAAYVGVLLLMGGVGLLEGAALPPMALPIAFFSALAAFSLGTFDCVELKRNYFGKIAVTRTWHTCFIPRKPTKISLRGIEAVATSATAERTLLDWLLLASMLSLFFLPGILWWIFVFAKPTQQVALTRTHGQIADVLYQGPNEEQANDMARTISDVCRYRWRRNY